MLPPARRSRTPSRQESALFELAPRKGYSLEDAISKGFYRLRFDITEELATRENGSAAWSIAAALKFLRRQPDVD